jgi:hypothetical protein
VHSLVQFVFSGNYHQPTRLHTAIKLFGVTPPGGWSISCHPANISRPVRFAAGLSDRDAKGALHVVSLQHLGLGNTLVGLGTCSYGYRQKIHRNCNVAVVVVFFFVRKKGRKKERKKETNKAQRTNQKETKNKRTMRQGKKQGTMKQNKKKKQGQKQKTCTWTGKLLRWRVLGR